MTERTNLFPDLIQFRGTNHLKMAIAASIILWCATLQQTAADTCEEHEITIVQQQKVKTTGTVADQNGEAMIDVSIKVKDNITMGTVTNLNGGFSFGAPKSATLEISYIGYKTVTVKAEGMVFNITMKEDAEVLDEVIVVDYGSQKEVNVTGAVGMVSPDVLEARPVQNVSQALQGVVPGLNLSVGSSGGALDSSMSINTRDTGIIDDGSGSSPLILIDDIEDDLNSVNPNDIEDVSVLKGAASASIYGTRAAFGVVLVTTKSGKSGKTRVSHNDNVRFSDALCVPEMMGSYQFAQCFNRAAENAGDSGPFSQEILDHILAYQAGTLKETMTMNEQTRRWRVYGGANANTCSLYTSPSPRDS